jgi:hypothetical protein
MTRSDQVALFGDLHNHCGMSYGHGSLEDALRNARERLDFVSVTGHAFWPDMPSLNERNGELRRFHIEGFERLKQGWSDACKMLRDFDSPGSFCVFPGYEMHSMADGDHTIIHRDLDDTSILYADGLVDLQSKVMTARADGRGVLAFPHHIGYRRGHRGINWDAFQSEVSPIVEIVSMHGCSESDEGPRPFLHTMGPSDHRSTMAYGLSQGHVFGVIGGTDHHSAHPGSYGHGLCGAWADDRSRSAIWTALQARRCWAMTGDKIRLDFSTEGCRMGDVGLVDGLREFKLDVIGGGALDYVDILRNNQLVKRFSQTDVPTMRSGSRVKTRLFLEVGWGPRGAWQDWDVTIAISDGEISDVDARFRGRDVVSPKDQSAPDGSCWVSHWTRRDSRVVHMTTVTLGNANNFTPGTQGICLDVDMPLDSDVIVEANRHRLVVPLRRLVEGAVAEPLADMPAPSIRLHRAPMPEELHWALNWIDTASTEPATYYLRVRQRNGHWAWSSPIFLVES